MSKIKSPREKKDLSLKRDRRNAYGESPHAARRNIPLNKARRLRHIRRVAKQKLFDATIETAEDIQENVTEPIPPGWQKYPDISLEESIKNKLERREKVGSYMKCPSLPSIEAEEIDRERAKEIIDWIAFHYDISSDYLMVEDIAKFCANIRAKSNGDL